MCLQATLGHISDQRTNVYAQGMSKGSFAYYGASTVSKQQKMLSRVQCPDVSRKMQFEHYNYKCWSDLRWGGSNWLDTWFYSYFSILWILTPSIRKCNKKGGSPLSFSRYLTSKMSILHHFRPDVIMAFYGKRTFLGLPSCIKTFILKKRVTIFFSKTNTVRLDDRSLH